MGFLHKNSIRISANNGNSQIFVTQMLSAALTSIQNSAMMLRKLKTQDPTLRGNVEYPVILMIKKKGELK